MAKPGPPATSVQPHDLAVLMQQHLHKLDHCTFAGTCTESVHKQNASLFAILLSQTHRLNQKVVKAALKEAAPGMSAFQSTQCAKLLVASFSDLNRKRLNATSGRNLAPFYRKIFGQVYVENARPPKAQRCASKSSVPEASRVAELYGLPTDDAEIIDSSQESKRQRQQKERLQKDLPSWWNTSKKTMEAQSPRSQAPVFASMESGPNGYLLAHWPDGSHSQTEVANLALTTVDASVVKPCKKPAANNYRKSASFGLFRKHVGSDEAYIQYYHEGRWLCLVHISGKFCDMHHAILADELLDYAGSSQLIAREQVLERKQKLAAALGGS